MCVWRRVDELQQQEAAIRVAMDIASTEKHKVSLCAMLHMAMCYDPHIVCCNVACCLLHSLRIQRRLGQQKC